MGKVAMNRIAQKAKGIKAGQALIAAFDTELARIKAGGHPLHNARTVEVPNDPGEYAPADVAAVRAIIGVSQSVFARLMGASRILVSAWEQGQRTPNPMARRMLDEIKANPARWAAMVKPRSDDDDRDRGKGRAKRGFGKGA